MRVIDRLLKYLSSKNITAYSFEKNCLVANGYLKKQQKGKGRIGSDILDRIHRNYSDLNLFWLVTGKGRMLTDEKEDIQSLVTEDKHAYARDEVLRSLNERIQLLERALADKEKIILLLESKLSASKK